MQSTSWNTIASAALLTITTPHRGSPYADWCIETSRKLGGLC